MESILRRRLLGTEEEFLVMWEGDYLPTWQKGHILRSDYPELVEKFMQIFYNYIFSVFAWYTCISATYVRHSSGESFEGDLRPNSPELNWKTVSGLLSLACSQSQWSPETTSSGLASLFLGSHGRSCEPYSPAVASLH